MRNVISNAFSVNMLRNMATLCFIPASIDNIKFFLEDGEIYSIIGHKGTADLLTAKLGIEIKYNRENYAKKKDDRIIVCLPNRRLDEGQVLSQEELEKINIKFWIVQ
jgi:hypothetical protein